MIYVISEAGTILNKIDAWERNAEEKMMSWISAAGYELLSTEITFMGNMIMKVKGE